MRRSILALTATSGAIANAASLATACTAANALAALPANGTLPGSYVISSSVTANAVYNTSVSGQTFFPDATVDFCNVTFAYSHEGRGDTVGLTLYLPSPDNFQNRWLASGGMAYSINGGVTNLIGGVMYGAASGLTDGGFNTAFDSAFLLANGTIDWVPTYMFGYQAIGEMTTLGKEFTKQFYTMASETKLYTYFQGCSDGGREGWSQAQRWGQLYDGVIAGAPAFRYGQQQVNHLFSNVVEQTLNYYPPPCELELIVNETISNCDALDGKVDGVVSRTDLCKLNFNINSTIGLPYACAASTGGGIGLGYGKHKRQFAATTTPAQNGTVSAEGVAVAQAILDGLIDSEGRQAYLSYQPSASFTDATTSYDSTTDTWELDIASTGGEWVARFLELQDADNLDTLTNVTYDTLRDWMQEGWDRYADSLQTNNPDLTEIYNAGGKILHFHGESDPSVPTASSVHYYESVRKIMYPNLSFNESTTALKDWYRLYLVPGAAHCAINSAQANGPFPQTNLQVMINWVENATVPVTLNATHMAGDEEGTNAQICAWPLRPLWSNNGTTQNCVFDQASYDTWTYDFTAFKLPLY
ncbi:carboxylic ester hydrolase-31 [Coleophoma cylindrospora]|uniref:Carboxylic ester hydrolase n=1 Tax=Coleophoma cylindrospora TaxID=1849047 RepID=A0A3D8Q3V7_9HELO|nr:carboxylic ester hydrolase-31 [Coleophoma cylindrospora]